MAALLRFTRIFKEPMISSNSFGKKVKCIDTTSCLHWDNRTHCPNVRFHSFSRKHFVVTKLFRIVFAGPYVFLVGQYAFFWLYHLDAYGPHMGTFFLWFSRSYDKQSYVSFPFNRYYKINFTSVIQPVLSSYTDT